MPRVYLTNSFFFNFIQNNDGNNIFFTFYIMQDLLVWSFVSGRFSAR